MKGRDGRKTDKQTGNEAGKEWRRTAERKDLMIRKVLCPCSRVHRLVFLPLYTFTAPPAYLLHLYRPFACLTYPLPASYTTSALLPASPTILLIFYTSSTFLLPSGTPPSFYLHCLPFHLPPTYTSAVLFPTTSAPFFSVLATSSYLLHASLLHHIQPPSYLVKYSCLALPPA
ncbi:hypothetical protein Pmani_021373 [Petrolisthes manimaculis]|uniref:Uncharacterized protein n=1 Tax=Petrolisthes manimaculis TaxID=1843537 RepID=A0AAE1PGE9_9EUCA|nr:hypothetical protein Pmani_021373 [Petrolisthes manimaculis]